MLLPKIKSNTCLLPLRGVQYFFWEVNWGGLTCLSKMRRQQMREANGAGIGEVER